MRRVQQLALASALALLALLPSVLAHGAESGMDMSSGSIETSHSETSAATTMTEFEYNPSYFHYTKHVGLINAHIALSILSWTIILPLAVVLSIARSRYTILAQTAFLVTNGLGVLTGLIHRLSTPDLYEHNVHGKLGWIITWLALGWAATGVILSVAGAWKTKTRPAALQHRDSQQTLGEDDDHMAAHKMDGYRWSDDSGQGTERNTNSLYTDSRTSSMNSGTQQFSQPERSSSEEHDREDENEEAERRGFLGDSRVERAVSRYMPRLNPGKGLLGTKVIYIILERFMVILGFFGVTTGIVVYGGIFHGSDFFSGLAHFIKGGIFVWYGLLTFGRWMGCFADLGWAWNVKPGADIVGKGVAWVPSAEFTESFVIWLYGVINVFLEHLGDRAGNNYEWSAVDLEHVSISILFFGGGMLGMLIESSTVRELLSNTLNTTGTSHPDRWHTPKHFVHSLNPLPALTIMLMGIMMSSHTQHSMVATMMHKYWGQLFVAFAMTRGLTYITLWLKPPTSYLPSRPPTEIITSFCLISGGFLFMGSNHDTVNALEHYNLHAMFLWTLAMSFVAMLMAWELVLMAIKNWASRHESSRSSFAQVRRVSPA